MPKRNPITKSSVRRPPDRVSEARNLLAREREHLLAQVHTIDRILENLDSFETAATNTTLGKSLDDLFTARDRAEPGSMEEEHAVEKILETMFPDSNAG